VLSLEDAFNMAFTISHRHQATTLVSEELSLLGIFVANTNTEQDTPFQSHVAGVFYWSTFCTLNYFAFHSHLVL